MLDRAFESPGPIVWDADGFMLYSTDGLRLEGGVAARVHPDDHEPPHAHLEVPGQPRLKLTSITD